jgi:hypothetical protein
MSCPFNVWRQSKGANTKSRKEHVKMKGDHKKAYSEFIVEAHRQAHETSHFGLGEKEEGKGCALLLTLIVVVFLALALLYETLNW